MQFEHTIKFNGLGRVTYENMFMGDCSFLSLVRDPADVALPKKRRTTWLVTWWTKERSQSFYL